MVKWFLVALLTVPLIDAALLVWVGLRIGWPATVLLVVLTALVGTLLVRAEGRRTIRNIQRSLAEGNPPTDQLIDGGMLIAAGALLLTPGLVTDLLGFLIVLPITRIPIRNVLKSRVIVPRLDAETGGFTSGTVYTYGFPDEDTRSGVDPSDFDLGGNENTVNLDDDEYDLYDSDDDPEPDHGGDSSEDRNP